jgi:murein DD-endopeptidase MepM/ murein hydrolase activator NlpD
MAFKNRAEVTFENFGRFESQMKKLAENVGVESVGAVFPFYGKGGEDLAISPELREKYGKNFAFPEEIEKLDSLNRNVMRNTEQLRRVNSFVDNLRQVMRFTPSLWPVNGGGFVTSHFGPRRSPFTGMPSFHSGIDIAWWPGSQIKTTAAGEVKFVGYEGAYGLTVRIKHKYGFSTRYAHLQSVNVSAGQNVEKGQSIGGMGNTGRATGYHLHYEVILGNTVIDPQPYLTSRY